MHSLHFYYSFQSIGEVHGETVLKDRTSILCDRDKCKSRKTELAHKYKNQSTNQALLAFLDNGVNVTVHFISLVMLRPSIWHWQLDQSAHH